MFFIILFAVLIVLNIVLLVTASSKNEMIWRGFMIGLMFAALIMNIVKYTNRA